jgi:hypothetical protein
MSVHISAGPIDRYSIRKYLLAPTIVAISSSTAKTGSALSAGHYRVSANVDCFIKQGAQASITAATTDTPLFAGDEVLIVVTGSTDAGVAAITGGASGSLYIKAVEASI